MIADGRPNAYFMYLIPTTDEVLKFAASLLHVPFRGVEIGKRLSRTMIPNVLLVQYTRRASREPNRCVYFVFNFRFFRTIFTCYFYAVQTEKKCWKRFVVDVSKTACTCGRKEPRTVAAIIIGSAGGAGGPARAGNIASVLTRPRRTAPVTVAPGGSTDNLLPRRGYATRLPRGPSRYRRRP